MRTWLHFADEASFGRAAASHVGRLARRALGGGPVFRLALSGGRSPLPLFDGLADPGLFPAGLWARTHIFFADERMVPPDHPDSNYGAVAARLLRRVPVPEANVHPMRGDLPAERAADDYEKLMLAHFGCPPGQAPAFDLVVLGMGADGHTASLFPGAEPDPRRLAASVPPPDASPRVARLTLTPRALNAAREILFLVLGADKHPALRRILAGDGSLPAARIDARPQSWYLCPALNDNTP